MNKSMYRADPFIHSISDSTIIFTPNLDLNRENNYIREIYVALIQETKVKENKSYERILWDTLIKKQNKMNLNKKEVGRIEANRVVNSLKEGKLLLKVFYFYYIGHTKEKTFAEIKPQVSML